MSALTDLIKKFLELADHPDCHLAKHSNISAVLTSCDELREAARFMQKLVDRSELDSYEQQLQRVKVMEGQPGGTYLIELRPTAFENNPHHRILLAKAFEKGDRMIVPIGKVPVIGDIMQLGRLDLEPEQVVLRIAPKVGEPVATVYVKVHP